MRSKTALFAGAIALAVCLVCPLVDLFDQWDHALQTGQDTEYQLFVLALCVGLALALRGLIVRLSSSVALLRVGYALQSALSSSPILLIPAPFASASGGPPLSLRI